MKRGRPPAAGCGNQLPFSDPGTAALKHWNRITNGCGIAAIVFFSCAWLGRQVGGVSANARDADPPTFLAQVPLSRGPETALVPAGTRINIRLEKPSSREKRSAGDRFTASLYGPLIVDGKLLASSRCQVIGQWTQGEESSRVNGGSRSTAVLRKLVVNGNEYDIDTEPLELAEFTAQKRVAAEIAGGAAAGAVIGGASVGGDSTTAYRKTIKRITEAHEPEAWWTFTLSSPAELPVIRTMGGMEK